MSKFIVFEGIDGSGKSTQIDLIIKKLIESKVDYSLLREPGTTQISEKIREILLDSRNDIGDLTETLLFLAARAQLVKENLQADLKLNKLVICDRHSDSTLAYQGYGKGVDLEAIKKLNFLITKGINPILTIVIDVSYDVSIQRRGIPQDRMELNGKEFFNKIRAGYKEIVQENPDTHIIVDGNNDPSEINKIIWKEIKARCI
tara:strand:+ start:78 stop:686 length:609 start_codon:yes stop_codon:yes gene_type:complete